MKRLVVLLLLAIPIAGCFTVRPPSLASLGLGDILGEAEWEYRQEIDCPDPAVGQAEISERRVAMMNRLGRSRWELVAIESVSGPEELSCAVLTFKRRRD
jgi:hypothetical protein